MVYEMNCAIAGDYPLDLASKLQGLRSMGNGCSVSGGWILKAWEHEYIDKRVFLVVTLFCRDLGVLEESRRLVQFLGLHWW